MNRQTKSADKEEILIDESIDRKQLAKTLDDFFKLHNEITLIENINPRNMVELFTRALESSVGLKNTLTVFYPYSDDLWGRISNLTYWEMYLVNKFREIRDDEMLHDSFVINFLKYKYKDAPYLINLHNHSMKIYNDFCMMVRSSSRKD